MLTADRDRPGDGPRARPGLAAPRWALVAAAVACAASLAAYLAVGAKHPAAVWPMGDLRVYRWGGLLARNSGPLYSAAFGRYHLPFTYPPAAAAVFAAASFLPLAALEVLITVVSLVCLAAAAWVAWGAAGVRAAAPRAAATLAVTAVALWTDPVQQTLGFGQVNLILLAIVLADLCQPDGRRWKGAGVGLATGIKLTPAIFIVYLLLTRRLRAAATAAAVFAATVVAGFALLPSQSRRYWFGGLFYNSGRGTHVFYVANQSLQGVVTRLAGGPASGRAAWVAAAVVVGVAGMVVAVLAHRRGRELDGILAAAVTGLLISPITWDHHWVWVVPLLVAALGLAREHRVAGWACAAALTVAFLTYPLPRYPGGPSAPKGLIWTAPFGGHHGRRNFHWHGVQLLAGNLYAVAGLAALAVVAFAILGSREREVA